MRPFAVISLFSVIVPGLNTGEEIEDRSFCYAKEPAPDKSDTYEAEARADAKECASDDHVHELIYYIDCHVKLLSYQAGSGPVARHPACLN